MDRNASEYLSSPELLDKISDVIRIIDPLEKKIVEYKNNTTIVEEIHCFDFWGRNKVCDNCISMRAYNDNNTFVKIEYKENRTYMITAVSLSVDDKKIIVEIIKDITSSILFDSNEDDGMAHPGIHALIDNMNKLAFNDSLTGIYNRRYIMEKLPVDLLNSSLLATELSIIMADIDYFKKVNDNFGHLAGDQALKTVANVLSGCIKRDSDWIARFGGEEFMICMPGANLDIARKTAERMRQSIENAPIQYDGKNIGVTVSFGIYSLTSAGHEKAEDLLKLADEKLYQAKLNGRNRVEY